MTSRFDTAAARASCRCEFGRADRSGRSGGRRERLERTLGRVRRVAQRRRSDTIVSLRTQRITVYDAKGWILRAPVSSGSKGRETPAGIFSVIQKVEDHYSNLYDDAYMPHMQRITWLGIALHGSALPGYPASHGCVRLPIDFAARLFDATAMGMRVIVSPTEWPRRDRPSGSVPAEAGCRRPCRRAYAEAEAARKAVQARLDAGTAYREATRAMMPVRVAENLKLRAEAQVAAAETTLGLAISAEAKQQAESAKAQAVARIAQFQVQWDAAKAELQPKLDCRHGCARSRRRGDRAGRGSRDCALRRA